MTEASPRLTYWPTQLARGISILISILVAVVADGDEGLAPRHDADVEIDASRVRQSRHWALLPAHSLRYWAAACSAHIAAGEARSSSRDAGAASCEEGGLRPGLTANGAGPKKLTPRSAGLTLVAWCQSMSANAVLTGIRIPLFGRCIAGPQLCGHACRTWRRSHSHRDAGRGQRGPRRDRSRLHGPQDRGAEGEGREPRRHS